MATQVADPFVWGSGGARLTPEAIAERRKVAQALLKQGGDYSPVESPWQGVARVAQAMMGGLDARAADVAERRNMEAEQALWAELFGGGTGAAASPAAPMQIQPTMGLGPEPAVETAPLPAPGAAPTQASEAAGAPTQALALAAPQAAQNPYGNAIASIESGGRYDLVGPVANKSGDRAYGKYQVMGANVGPWTREVLGREMTPQEFLASPEAQEAVFNAKFGSYVQKYGPEGAARAWFAGEGGMNNPNARDVLGTTVAGYADKFNRNLGQGGGAPAMQVAQASTGGGFPGVNPRILQALTSPYVSEGTKRVAQILLQQQMQQGKVSTVDLGNSVGVMDARGNIIRQIPKQRDPTEAEAKRLDLELKRKNLNDSPTVQRIKQPDGSEVAVQWDAKTGQWIPLVAPQGGNAVAAPKLTEQQSKDVGFYNRGKELLPRLQKQDEALTDLWSSGAAAIGGVGNYLKSDEYRQAEQSGKELLAVILRKDTGAAVTPQEFQMYGEIYLPKPGDDAATIQQKRAARQTAIEGLRMGLGPAEIIFRSQQAAEEAKKAPQPQQPEAVERKTIGGKTYFRRDGQWYEE